MKIKVFTSTKHAAIRAILFSFSQTHTHSVGKSHRFAGNTWNFSLNFQACSFKRDKSLPAWEVSLGEGWACFHGYGLFCPPLASPRSDAHTRKKTGSCEWLPHDLNSVCAFPLHFTENYIHWLPNHNPNKAGPLSKHGERFFYSEDFVWLYALKG